MDRDAVAAELFPAAWRRATGPGERQRKRRHTLRQRAETELKLRELRASSASCVTCRAYVKHPQAGFRICDRMSDFYGYARARPDGLCTDWSALTAESTHDHP